MGWERESVFFFLKTKVRSLPMSHAEGGRRLVAADPHFHLPTRHRCHPWDRSHNFWRVWTVSYFFHHRFWKGIQFEWIRSIPNHPEPTSKMFWFSFDVKQLNINLIHSGSIQIITNQSELGLILPLCRRILPLAKVSFWILFDANRLKNQSGSFHFSSNESEPSFQSELSRINPSSDSSTLNFQSESIRPRIHSDWFGIIRMQEEWITIILTLPKLTAYSFNLKFINKI